MRSKKKYSWVFRYCDVINGNVCYRLYHKLTVDDVDFLADKFCKANSGYCLDVFKLRLRKRNASG